MFSSCGTNTYFCAAAGFALGIVCLLRYALKVLVAQLCARPVARPHVWALQRSWGACIRPPAVLRMHISVKSNQSINSNNDTGKARLPIDVPLSVAPRQTRFRYNFNVCTMKCASDTTVSTAERQDIAQLRGPDMRLRNSTACTATGRSMPKTKKVRPISSHPNVPAELSAVTTSASLPTVEAADVASASAPAATCAAATLPLAASLELASGLGVNSACKISTRKKLGLN